MSKVDDVSHTTRVAEELRFLVLAAQREGQRLLADALRPLGVTPTQSEALSVLEAREPLTLGELGGLLIAETGSPSRLVSGLVQAGLVARSPSREDRRSVVLRLTAEGRRVAREIVVAEASLYRAIDAAIAGHDVAATLALLRAFVADRPTGRALQRRAG